MDWEMVAPMVIGVVFILTTGGVLILRPIAKRLGDLIEVYGREKESGLRTEVGQMRDLLETMNARMQLLEERQDFTERLLSPGTEEGEARGARASSRKLPGSATP